MSWILMVWSLSRSKSAIRATGKNYGFTVYTKMYKYTDLNIVLHNSSLFNTSDRSCRLAPLIQCDYCPLLFHMDCLDPPLTALPAGKWMCPNHVEHLVVRVLVIVMSTFVLLQGDEYFTLNVCLIFS